MKFLILLVSIASFGLVLAPTAEAQRSGQSISITYGTVTGAKAELSAAQDDASFDRAIRMVEILCNT